MRIAFATGVCLLLCLGPQTRATEQLVEWPAYGGDPGGSKYSPLADIDRNNAGRLRIVWRWRTGERPLPEYGTSPGKFEATPIMIQDALYVSTPYNRVVALDATSGKELWAYDPHSYEAGPGPIGVPFGQHRGVAAWTDGTSHRIFINSRWRLIALDAKTGRPIPAFGTNGEVDLTGHLAWAVDKTHYQNTSPPVVYKNLVIVGSAIADSVNYSKSPPGDVQAFDARTGKFVWRFGTTPQRGEFGNDTWEGNSAATYGHSNVWAPFTVDVPRGLVYLPVSTSASDYYGGARKGANLFADSLVCLDANTGQRVWHFQTVHHGLWDYDGVMTPNLVTLRVNGRTIDAVAAVSKNGFTYVFDRVTGTPVWPIEERPVPQSDVPGERTSPTQPVPAKPPAFTRQGFSADDVVDFTPELKALALEKLKGYRFGPLYTPPSLQGTVLMPGNAGGASWGGASVDPETGILYVRSSTWPKVIQLKKPAPAETAPSGYPGVVEGEYWWHFPTVLTVAGGVPIHKPPYGTITAIDLNKGEQLWQITAGDTPTIRALPALKGLNLPPLGSVGNAGALLTGGGLVFYTAGDRVLYAADKATGRSISQVPLDGPGDATPMTYRTRGGRQFVVVATGSGTEATLVGLALEGSAAAAAAAPAAAPPALPAARGAGVLDWRVLAPDGPGKDLLVQRCFVCHDLSVIVSSRGDSQFWQDSITKMVAQGANVQAADIPPLVAYLSTHFAANRPRLALPLNINTATAEQLALIPPLAAYVDAIIALRSTARFARVEDLTKVAGLTEAVVQKVKPLLTAR